MTGLAGVLAGDVDTLDGMLAALDGIGCEPRRTSSGWSLRCPHPGHEDDTPSATLRPGDSAPWLLHCHGCNPRPDDKPRWLAEVVARITAGTPLAPASPSGRRRGSGGGGGGYGMQVAAYDYVSADGELVAQKVRYASGERGKSFGWRRPIGDAWVDGLHGKPLRELPMYGLHSLDLPGTAYVVEGEKDADRLHQLGVPAVTSAGGARGELPDDLAALVGRDVIVVADRDAPGIEYAHAWAARLDGVAASVRLAQAAVATPGADVSDHLDAGLDLDALDFGPVTAPDPPPDDRPPSSAAQDEGARDLGMIDWAAFWQHERADADYIIPGLLPEGSSASTYSGPGAGKSLLVLEWSVCIATGQHIMGERVTPGHVLYIDHEMDHDLLEDRLLAMGVDEATDLHRLHYSLLGDWPPLDTPEGGRALLEAAQGHGAGLVVVDTISRAIEGEENPADTWLRLYRHTVRPLKKAGIAFLRLDHSGKDATKGERGSSAKRSDVDLVYKVEPVSADRINLVRQKNRIHLPGPDVIALKREADPLRHVRVTVDLQRERKISDLLAAIDRLDLPADAGRTVIGRALKDAGVRSRNADLSIAIQRRKAGPPPVPTLRVGDCGDRSAEPLRDSRGQVGDHAGTGSRPTPGQPPRAPVPTESGTGSRAATGLLDILAPCDVCHLPAVSNPCTTCRRVVSTPATSTRKDVQA